MSIRLCLHHFLWKPSALCAIHDLMVYLCWFPNKSMMIYWVHLLHFLWICLFNFDSKEISIRLFNLQRNWVWPYCFVWKLGFTLGAIQFYLQSFDCLRFWGWPYGSFVIFLGNFWLNFARLEINFSYFDFQIIQGRFSTFPLDCVLLGKLKYRS